MRARVALMSSPLWLLLAPPVAAQARISKVIPRPDLVRVFRAGATRPEPADTVQVLVPGDMLMAGDESLVELSCVPSRGNTYRLKGPFRVMIDVPLDTTCHVNVMAGHGDVIAESPTTTTVGGVPLGSTGTQYAVDVTNEGGQLNRRVAVFEGTVKELKSGIIVEQGLMLRLTGRRLRPSPVSTEAIERSAEVNARLDVASAARASRDPASEYQQLKQLYSQVLARPADTASRVALAKRQIDLKVNAQAAYNLKRANVTTDAQLRRYQINPEAVRSNPAIRERIYRTPAGVSPRRDTTAKTTLDRALTERVRPPRDNR